MNSVSCPYSHGALLKKSKGHKVRQYDKLLLPISTPHGRTLESCALVRKFALNMRSLDAAVGLITNIFLTTRPFEAFWIIFFLVCYGSMTVLVPVVPDIAFVVRLLQSFKSIRFRDFRLSSCHISSYHHDTYTLLRHSQPRQIRPRNSRRSQTWNGASWEVFEAALWLRRHQMLPPSRIRFLRPPHIHLRAIVR